MKNLFVSCALLFSLAVSASAQFMRVGDHLPPGEFERRFHVRPLRPEEMPKTFPTYTLRTQAAGAKLNALANGGCCGAAAPAPLTAQDRAVLAAVPQTLIVRHPYPHRALPWYWWLEDFASTWAALGVLLSLFVFWRVVAVVRKKRYAAHQQKIRDRAARAAARARSMAGPGRPG